MTKNKNHWYDGWFYDKLIAPNQDQLFGQIKNLVDADSIIIDVGCGTGRLAFGLGDKCKSVLGIDLSKRNIDRANLTLLQNPDSKISFENSDIGEIINKSQIHFDYAVLTYVIHEVNDEERINLLNEISRVADKIIIGDYLVPKPKGFRSYLSEIIEFIAGAEHYRNYKSFVANGGIKYLANKAELKIIHEISNHPLTNHIVILSKSDTNTSFRQQP
jgi:ubiquinone/menaquinone biosynthesis C-methylase UbiE